MTIRQITYKDKVDLKKVYFDAIISINEDLYSKDQKIAWASQAWENKSFNNSINSGNGWLICDNKRVLAFATRYPNNRISLLYCRGESQRKGYGKRLLYKLEKDAKDEGLNSLTTEASLISYKLFLVINGI